MPPLGHAATGELNVALVEGRVELEQEKRLFEIEETSHDQLTLAASGPAGRHHDGIVERIVDASHRHRWTTQVIRRASPRARQGDECGRVNGGGISRQHRGGGGAHATETI